MTRARIAADPEAQSRRTGRPRSSYDAMLSADKGFADAPFWGSGWRLGDVEGSAGRKSSGPSQPSSFWLASWAVVASGR
jgi:hypothetical protein